MSACHDLGCKERCRACEMSKSVVRAMAEVQQPVGADKLGDMLLVGHIMAMISTMQQRGPLARLHLCTRHRDFAIAQGSAMGVNIFVPPHVPEPTVNALAAKGVN